MISIFLLFSLSFAIEDTLVTYSDDGSIEFINLKHCYRMLESVYYEKDVKNNTRECQAMSYEIRKTGKGNEYRKTTYCDGDCNFIPVLIEENITNSKDNQYKVLSNDTLDFYAILTYTSDSDSTCAMKSRYLKQSYLKSDKGKCIKSLHDNGMSYRHNIKFTKSNKHIFIRDVWKNNNCNGPESFHMELECGTCSHSNSETEGYVFVNCE